ncbi:MAG TPA: tetratricopeptide repeat protein [Abditibacteriaceae bacterium]|jgi:tetratricopeptide (TPR) repeat protein
MIEFNLNALWQDSKLFGSVFLGGIVGNWMASAGQWTGKRGHDLIRDLLANDLETLWQNHHLQRALRIAQCRAMQASCVRCLEKDYQQVVPLLKSEVSHQLWQRMTNEEVRAIIWWMKQFENEARRAESKRSSREWEDEIVVAPKDVAALHRAGAEIGRLENYEALKEKITAEWVTSLEIFQRQHFRKNPISPFEDALLQIGVLPGRLIEMPETLQAVVRDEWFDLLRVAFRELMKSGEHKEANIAFQNDILARLSDAPSLDQIEELLDAKDAEWTQRWHDTFDLLEEITANLDEVLGLLRHLPDEVANRVIAALREELAAQGQIAGRLSQEELERELAARVPDLRPEELHRLITYALFKSDISRINRYAPTELIGREEEMQLLNDAWGNAVRGEKPRPRVLCFVAMGGEGKTSLVAKWAADLAARDWPGCDVAFAWSFYRQGTREQLAASSDLFLREALTFFGDEAMANSAAGISDKGKRLAQLVGERRALLLLDGLEPLQYPPHPPHDGALKDNGIIALLNGLAANSNGLCIITTRYTIPDLHTFIGETVREEELARLSTAAGVALLKALGVRGTQAECEKLVEDVKGHALTLNLLGSFLKRAFHGDIRQRDRVKFEKADAKIQGGHAFRAMAAYVRWMEDESEESRRELAILQLLGLFDRPATADCVDVLRQAPAIPGLTEPLVEVDEDDWEFSLSGLQEAKLLTVNRDEASGMLLSLDAHPLLREYFAKRLREQQPEAWRAAHRRLYDYLCATTHEGEQPTLEELQPLYQAVSHGCQAGLHEDALNIYKARILKGDMFYSVRRLGTWGTDLATLFGFFEIPREQPTQKLSVMDQAFVLNESGRYLRALGRCQEAVSLIRGGLNIRVTQAKLEKSEALWAKVAGGSNNLVMILLLIGNIHEAVEVAEQSVEFADASDDLFYRVASRAHLIKALHLKGEVQKGKESFEIALDELDNLTVDEWDVNAFDQQWRRLCDFLLDTGNFAEAITRTKDVLSKAERRGEKWAIGANLLVLGESYFTLENFSEAESCFHKAIENLRETSEELPRALASRAKLHAKQGQFDKAQEDLDEAWDIAKRGPMRLFMADIHLYCARLFFRETDYPWQSPQVDLAAARRLIEECGYGRRREELEDAEAMILS